MKQCKSRPKSIYKYKRYWFHVSSTLKRKIEFLHPRDNDEGFNRADHEPNVRRICVSPTLEQCLTAIPYSSHDTIKIYKTRRPIKVKKSVDVFDSFVTGEKWITNPTKFVKIGVLKFEKINKYLDTIDPEGKEEGIISESASQGTERYSQEVYKWWKKLKPWRFVEPK